MRWRLSGIERDVYLQAYPRTTVWNFFLKPDLDSRYENGIFKAVVALRDFAGNSKGRGHVEMKLLDGAGTTVWKQKREFKMAGGQAGRMEHGDGRHLVGRWDTEAAGLGGDNSWGMLPHRQYRLLDKRYTYGYVIRLLDGANAGSSGRK